jgi:hypothetical protein
MIGQQPTDARGSSTLDDEQSDQDRQRDRYDEFLECWRHQLEPLHGREHRDRRRDDAVSVQQRGAQDAEENDDRELGAIGNPIGAHKREEREDAALALVVGAQDDDDIFQGHHHHECPEDQRDDAEHVGRSRDRMDEARKGHLERVERARPDIAIDDTERRQRQEPGTARMMEVPGLAGVSCTGTRDQRAGGRYRDARRHIHAHPRHKLRRLRASPSVIQELGHERSMQDPMLLPTTASQLRDCLGSNSKIPAAGKCFPVFPRTGHSSAEPAPAARELHEPTP